MVFLPRTVKTSLSPNVLKSTLTTVLVLAFLAVVVGRSIWLGYYNYDPHHWGLMLSNARDLYDGKLPYREIFIQYGFLTTVIHAIAYGWFGGNLTSVIAITSIAYAFGLWMIYRLTFGLTADKKLALYVFITCFLFHPTVIYPWSNYIAFPFLVYGVSVLVLNPTNYRKRFFGGFAFGLAILSRESLAPAIFILIALSTLVDFIQPKIDRRKISISVLPVLSGMLLPIAIFFTYIVSTGLLSDWYKLSWLLPQMYAKLSVFPEAAFGLLSRWPPDFSYILSILPEPRWQLFFVILVANLSIIALAVTRGKFAFLAPGLVKIAFATLLFMSSTIHIPEIFRVATGYIIGVISLYVVLKHYKLDNYAFVAFVVLLLFFSTPLSGIRSAFVIIPRKPQLVESPDFFKGQRWPKKYVQYYQNIDADLKILKNARCGIEFHYNDTVDSFLQLLSPFIQYQIAPFPFDGNLSEVNTLRPDLDLSKKIEAASDIILFQYISPESFASYSPPEGFSVYRKYYPKPRIWNDLTYSYKDLMLIILAPNSCLEQLQ